MVMVAQFIKKAASVCATYQIIFTFFLLPIGGVYGASYEPLKYAVEGGTLTHDDARHLLSRTGFGASPADMIRFREMTRQQAIDTLLNEFINQPSVRQPAWVHKPIPHYHARPDLNKEEKAIFVNMRAAELSQLRRWWTLEMLQTPSPQTERLVLFWHDLFATSYYGTDRQSLAMARQNQTFRSLGMGTWDLLLKQMIRDAALLEYLNSNSNDKDSPNENLARELLELFTLGEGNYDEFTVKEAARSLTGHSTVRGHDLAFQLKTWKQDRGMKTLFGITDNFSGDDLIDVILKQRAAARFLAGKFWSAFVSDSEPDTKWLEQISEIFRNSNYQLAVLYRAVLESEAFWSAGTRGSMVKSPVDLLIGTARSLEYPMQNWEKITGWQSVLGMEFFAPPDVSGWKEGSAFITPGRLLNRYRIVSKLLADSSINKDDVNAKPMMSAPKKSNTGLDSRLRVRLAAEDYKGPVKYQVTIVGNNQRVWESGKKIFDYGHDTELYGLVADSSQLNWRTESIDAPDSVLDNASEVSIAFINDNTGPDGDRNLYVDAIAIDSQWISGSLAQQDSDCEPAIAANAWQMYCDGTLTFMIGDNTSQKFQFQPMWTASAVHIKWAKDEIELDRQTLNITLDHLNAANRVLHSMEFKLVAIAHKPVALQLESFGCWPSCVKHWPKCAQTDRHFVARRTLVFPLVGKSEPFWESDSPLACHFRSLESDDRILVSVLWNSVDELLSHAETTPRAQRFVTIIRKVQEKLRTSKFSVANTPYVQSSAVIKLNSDYRPVFAVPEDIVVDFPSVKSALQLQELLDSVSLPVSSLLVPELEGLDIKNFTFKDIIEHPAFQLK